MYVFVLNLNLNFVSSYWYLPILLQTEYELLKSFSGEGEGGCLESIEWTLGRFCFSVFSNRCLGFFLVIRLVWKWQFIFVFQIAITDQQNYVFLLWVSWEGFSSQSRNPISFAPNYISIHLKANKITIKRTMCVLIVFCMTVLMETLVKCRKQIPELK